MSFVQMSDSSSESGGFRERLAEWMRRGGDRLRSGGRKVRRRMKNLDPRDVKARLDEMDADSVRRRLDRIDAGFIEEGTRRATDADVQRVADEVSAIEERFERDGPLGRLLDDGRLLLSLVRDTWLGRYRAVPRWTVGAATFALLYVLNPLDLIPDAIPGVGALDDAAVVSLCLVLIEQDLLTYRAWLRDRGRRALSRDGSSSVSTEKQ